MAVYTEVSDEDLSAFVAEYDIGEIIACKGIAEGVENSNFLLQTDRNSYILTLYEKRVNPEDLPFFVDLMEHLARSGIACPTPIRGRDGEILRRLCNRPAAIVSFLRGFWPRRIEAVHCMQLGRGMAYLHQAGLSFGQRRINNLSVSGWRPLFEESSARASEVKEGLAEELAGELDFIEENWPKGLPDGVIHADLFPDNVFFLDGQLSGIIDFYFACTDFLAYDVAICLNAWCFEADGSFNLTKGQQLLNGYRSVRPLMQEELEALPLLCRGAAMRFLLTRLYDWLNTPSGALVKRKDPLEYLEKLRFHRSVKSSSAYGIVS